MHACIEGEGGGGGGGGGGGEKEQVYLGVAMTNTEIFHIFPIFSQLSSIFSISFHNFPLVFSISYHYSTWVSSIFSISFHNFLIT